MPVNPNPAAGKRPANARVGSYTRTDGTRVRTHTRSVGWTRSRRAWAGLGFGTLTSVAIVLEAGVTIVSTLAIILTAVLTAVAVIAAGYAEKNKKTLRAKTRTRRPAGTAPRRPTASSARRKTR